MNDLGPDDGVSSSKDAEIDLTPPPNDAKTHPNSAEAVNDAEAKSGIGEFHPWDPHKAAKDIEVGDFYFKLQNYKAAESRYREALYYKQNDALATYRLAVSLEKLNRPDEAIAEYQNYLKILPHGPNAEKAQKAIDHIQAASADTKSKK